MGARKLKPLVEGISAPEGLGEDEGPLPKLAFWERVEGCGVLVSEAGAMAGDVDVVEVTAG